jgi:hypothetical protein
MLAEGGRVSSSEVGANVGPCSRMLNTKNKATQLLMIVGAKANTLPFARCLRLLITPTKATSTEHVRGQAEGVDWMKTSAVPLRPLCCKTKALSKSTSPPRRHHPVRPMQDSTHGNGPREDKRITGRVCNSLYCNDCL